ncbi:MAG: SMI1/KNR4 family protein, partial [Acidobacteria bacterium]|nr:SMI1/KNR4 family protein [Acidobacteriota bacterium]
GLLPFAMTDNGDVLHWDTLGMPEDWTVIVNEARAPEYDEFESNFTDFLYGILTETVMCSIFPSGFPSKVVVFRLPPESKG